MKSVFFGLFTNPAESGIQDELLAMPEETMQSSFRSVFYNLFGFIVGFLLIMNRFDNRIGCFLWYVVTPLIFNIISVLLYRFFFKVTRDREHDYYTSYKYIIPGACINLFAYSYVVVIYRSIPQVWFIGFMPILLACYYKDARWFKVQSLLQCLFLAVMFIIRDRDLPYGLWDIEPIRNLVFFAMVLIQFTRALFRQDMLKRNVYANISAEEARMEVRRVYEANLSNDCQMYLDTINRAANEILAENEEASVHEYAQKIIQAGEKLKEAISEGKA